MKIIYNYFVLCFHFSKRSDQACLSINLLIETVLLKRRLNMLWVCESGLVKNIDRVVEEYRQTRWLLVSVQLCVYLHRNKSLKLINTDVD